jgi:hypothetical protein
LRKWPGRPNHGLSGAAVQGGHDVDGLAEHVLGCNTALHGSGDNAGAYWLGQNQHVAGQRAAVACQQIGMALTDDAHAELRFTVVDGVTADNGDTRLQCHLAAATHDLFEGAGVQQIARKADEVECEKWAGAHGVDVGQRVGRGDAAEVIRVVDDGREEVHRRHQSPLIGDAVHGGVVGRARVNEHGRVLVRDQVTQNLRQLGRPELTGSTRAMRELRKAQLLPLVAIVRLFIHGHMIR